jgi:hypothetical protein
LLACGHSAGSSTTVSVSGEQVGPAHPHRPVGVRPNRRAHDSGIDALSMCLVRRQELVSAALDAETQMQCVARQLDANGVSRVDNPKADHAPILVDEGVQVSWRVLRCCKCHAQPMKSVGCDPGFVPLSYLQCIDRHGSLSRE